MKAHERGKSTVVHKRRWIAAAATKQWWQHRFHFMLAFNLWIFTTCRIGLQSISWTRRRTRQPQWKVVRCQVLAGFGAWAALLIFSPIILNMVVCGTNSQQQFRDKLVSDDKISFLTGNQDPKTIISITFTAGRGGRGDEDVGSGVARWAGLRRARLAGAGELVGRQRDGVATDAAGTTSTLGISGVAGSLAFGTTPNARVRLGRIPEVHQLQENRHNLRIYKVSASDDNRNCFVTNICQACTTECDANLLEQACEWSSHNRQRLKWPKYTPVQVLMNNCNRDTTCCDDQGFPLASTYKCQVRLFQFPLWSKIGRLPLLTRLVGARIRCVGGQDAGNPARLGLIYQPARERQLKPLRSQPYLTLSDHNNIIFTTCWRLCELHKRYST